MYFALNMKLACCAQRPTGIIMDVTVKGEIIAIAK